MGNKKEKYIYISIIALIAVLMCNTNNNPRPLLEYIFPPIVKDGSVFYWGNIIAIITMYICTDKLWKIIKWPPIRKVDHYLHPFIREIIVLCLFAEMVQIGGESSIQFYKSFQKDVNAIYLQREDSNVRFNWYEYGYNGMPSSEKLIGTYQEILGTGKAGGQEIILSGAPDGYIVLKNCSSHAVGPFKIQLVAECNMDMPLKLEPETVYELPEEYRLGAKEARKINIENKLFEQEYQDFLEQISVSSTSRVKIILVSEDKEGVFEYKD